MQKKLLPLGIMLMSFSLLTSCGNSDNVTGGTSSSNMESTEISSQAETSEAENTSGQQASETAESSGQSTSAQESSEETSAEALSSEASSSETSSPEAPSSEQKSTESREASSQEASSGVGQPENGQPIASGEVSTEASNEASPSESAGQEAEGYVDSVEMNASEVQQEAEALVSNLAPAQSTILRPEASGVLTESNGYATIDYSNTGEGYVMVQYTASTQSRIKAQVAGPTTTYTYNLTPGQWTVFPLSDGNGTYQINVFENVVDNKYALVLSASQSVTLNNEFAPFLRSNQYVNFDNASSTIATAASLTKNTSDMLAKVEIIYNYVVDNISYDSEKASTVQSGYLPDLDAVLSSKKGICFDYASLMTGMLRSLGIPCKLVVGYAGDVYHAWISVWSEETGWVDGAVFFDGTTWQRMDPTFASTSGKDPTIMEYIGNGSNYTTKYIY